MSMKPWQYIPDMCSPANSSETHIENLLDLENAEEKLRILVDVDPASLNDQQFVDILSIICYYLVVIPWIIGVDIEDDVDVVRDPNGSFGDRRWAFFGLTRENIPSPSYYILDIALVIESTDYSLTLRRRVEDLVSALNAYAHKLQVEMEIRDLSDVCTTGDMAWWDPSESDWPYPIPATIGE